MENLAKIVCTIATGLVLGLTAAAQDANFFVTGLATNKEGVTISLYDASYQMIDSAVVKDGSFQLYGHTDTATMINLYASDRSVDIPMLVMPGSAMTADIDAWEVTGNKPTEQLNKLYQQHRRMMLTRREISYKMMATEQGPVFDSLKNLYYNCNNLMKQLVDSIGWDFYADNVGNPTAAHILLTISDIVTQDISLYDDVPTPGILRLFSTFDSTVPEVRNFPPLNRKITMLKAQMAVSKGQHFRDFEAEEYATGKTITLSSLIEGNVAVLDFWASWCGPCREEIQETLKPLHQKYAEKGLVVIGIDVLDRTSDHQKASEELNIPYPQLVDTDKNNSVLLYGIKGVPYIFLIDRNGNIIGNFRGEELEEAVEKALME